MSSGGLSPLALDIDSLISGGLKELSTSSGDQCLALQGDALHPHRLLLDAARNWCLGLGGLLLLTFARWGLLMKLTHNIERYCLTSLGAPRYASARTSGGKLQQKLR